MLSRILLFLLFSLFFQPVWSQHKHQMLSSMGSTSQTSSGVFATQTIGQTSVIGLYKNSRIGVSQGYQKPLLNQIIVNPQHNTLNIKVFLFLNSPILLSFFWDHLGWSTSGFTLA